VSTVWAIEACPSHCLTAAIDTPSKRGSKRTSDGESASCDEPEGRPPRAREQRPAATASPRAAEPARYGHGRRALTHDPVTPSRSGGRPPAAGHRDRARRLFGYDYTLEVYTPGHRRVHGYYSLPIFHDGQLIGRLDPKAHRAERRLEVRSVHFEPWFAKGAPPPAASWGAVDRDAALPGVGEALRSLAAFVAAEDVTVGRVTPGALGPALRRAVKGATPARTGAGLR